MRKTFYMISTLLIALVIYTGPVYAQEISTTVRITGIRAANGKITIGVFKDNASFDKEKAFKNFVFDKKAIRNGTMTVTIKLQPGTYGLSMLDDENGNGKMEKNMIGIPKEGFGFSNFYLVKLKKPTFDDFKVDLNTDQGKVDIKVKYL